MSFRFYTNMVSQASRGLAAVIFFTGLLLIGFGAVILVLPKIFAFLAAMVFFIAGVGCGITALKIFLAQKQLDKFTSKESSDYTESIEIFADRYSSDDS